MAYQYPQEYLETRSEELAATPNPQGNIKPIAEVLHFIYATQGKYPDMDMVQYLKDLKRAIQYEIDEEISNTVG